jgi:hypothetical protein
VALGQAKPSILNPDGAALKVVEPDQDVPFQYISLAGEDVIATTQKSVDGHETRYESRESASLGPFVHEVPFHMTSWPLSASTQNVVEAHDRADVMAVSGMLPAALQA